MANYNWQQGNKIDIYDIMNVLQKLVEEGEINLRGIDLEELQRKFLNEAYSFSTFKPGM